MKRRGNLLIAAGLLLNLSAMGLSAYNFIEAERAGQSVSDVKSQLEELTKVKLPPIAEPSDAIGEPELSVSVETPDEVAIPDYILNPQMEMPTAEVDGYAYIGVITIPSHRLSLPVISAWSDSALKHAPCRYSGSAYTDDLIVAGHDYRTHFKALRELSAGDTVTFSDIDGNVFTYEVSLREVIAGTDVDGIHEGDWDLTLFTCTVDGRSRVVVRCGRIENNKTALP